MAEDLMLWNEAADPALLERLRFAGYRITRGRAHVLVEDGAGSLVCVLRCDCQTPAEDAGRRKPR